MTTTKDEAMVGAELGPLDAQGQPVPRESVQRHARWMEAKLRKNDHKGGWTHENPKDLLRRAREELDELEKAVDKALTDGDARPVAAEAADVSNFAMMVTESTARLIQGGRDARYASEAYFRDEGGR